jgi:hypothetical protein
MLVSDYILKFLKKKKVSNFFLIKAGSISFAVHAFSRVKNKKYTCIVHEQTAAKFNAI